MTSTNLKDLTDDEQMLFNLIEEGKTSEVMDLINDSKVRLNCLEKSGMNVLDHACFKGNEQLVDFLLEQGVEVNHRHHEQGYTSLMFSALAGKPSICQALMNADARSDITNNIGKSASELAAFVGHFECVSVISSHISLRDVDSIIHPKGADSEQQQYPPDLAKFVHRLTRSHDIHPVRLALKVMDEELVMQHRQKALYTVDRLFERQLRCKEPNEMMSIKLWLILFTLREMLKFVEQRSDVSSSKAITLFAKNLLMMTETDLVRPVEERYLRTAVAAFPYKQSMLHQTMAKALSRTPVDQPPPAFLVICQILFGTRLVETGQFCLTCAVPSSKKRCINCKMPYCSVECQKLDWCFHKKCCAELGRRREKEEEELMMDAPEESIECDGEREGDNQQKID